MKVKVYRIERLFTGYGPYRNSRKGRCDAYDATDLCDSPNHPNPFTDDGDLGVWARRKGRKGIPTNYVCGYYSMIQYRDWFNTAESRTLLHQRGYFLVEYLIDSKFRKIGSRQIMFNKKLAQKSHVILTNQRFTNFSRNSP